MGWIITLCVLAGLTVLPLGIRAVYNAEGSAVYILLGPGRIKLLPGKNQEKGSTKEKDQKIKTQPNQAQKAKNKTNNKDGGAFSEFLPLLESILSFMDTFRWKLRVKYLQLRVVLAGEDPADLANNYGRAWSLLGNLIPLLERNFVIKKRDLDVACDFTADTLLIYGRLDLTITVGRLLSLVVTHGISILKQFLQIVKSRKGGK